MRDLRPSEYKVIREAQPLQNALVLPQWFPDVPPEVKIAIATYQGTPERFEVYQGDLGGDHLIVIARYNVNGEQAHVVAEYLDGAIVPERIPVTNQMVSRVEAASRERWSWKMLLGNTGSLTLGMFFLVLVAFLALVPGFPAEGSRRTAAIIMTGVWLAAGAFFIVGSLIDSWMAFSKRRRQLQEMVDLYRGGLVSGEQILT